MTAAVDPGTDGGGDAAVDPGTDGDPVTAAVDPVTAAVDPETAAWCDRCGGPAAEGPHDACAAARALEPPRYCPACRRRMKVQVVPTGWTATCVEHGTRTS